jgi:hypothetical protein
MVSEKIIVALLIIAILLTVISVTVTITALNSDMVPKISVNEQKGTPDTQKARVGLVIHTPQAG